MKPLYAFARAVTGFFLRLGNMTVHGREHIPAAGPILIVCNHTSGGDPPALANTFPYPLTFIAKEGFAQKRLTRWLFGAMGAVFLKKSASDLAAMRAALSELKGNRAVAIFPEGRRNFDQKISEFKPGASYISQRSQVGVLPVAMVNTGDILRFWRRNILVVVGPVIEPPSSEHPNKNILADYTALYQQRVGELFSEGRAMLEAQGRPFRGMRRRLR